MARSSVFVDSSVLFSALLSNRGTARDMINSAIEGRLSLCLSDFAINEVRKNLDLKAPGVIPILDTFLSADIFRIIDPSPEIVDDVARTFAQKDAPIIAGAIAGQCTHLATYDRVHLLSQSDRILQLHGIVTAPPDQILAMLL
ncbi:MAG: PIN domain-containing protein [Thermomicrobiales bacterium]|nr:PIN domain-containing protein [Thermomicrobiales bacterium]